MLDQLLSGASASTAFDQGGLLDQLKKALGCAVPPLRDRLRPDASPRAPGRLVAAHPVLEGRGRRRIAEGQGPEFIADAVKMWIAGVGAKTAYIEKASPWENGYVESFNGKLRDELLNGEVFSSLREAQVLIEEWRRHYNRFRPHSSLGYRPPGPETVPMARSQSGSGAGAAAMAH